MRLTGNSALHVLTHSGCRVVPVTAHAAFDKGAAYMGVKVHSVPVDPITRKADLKRVARAMCVPCHFVANYRPLLMVSQQQQHDHGAFVVVILH